ncbi:putative transporter [Danxiaibacter flavus]|uniref:Transporter n=1 Tax=Danxiaibacter flavus TaxID=3049108 RepID=A0ABV3ZI54_9BACT|nr:putative transporter [Chitinophagaceae bacterium DXS]
MDWFSSLWTQDSVAHSVLLYGVTIAVGVLLGRIKVLGVSLGVTWVLFTGLALSHFGFLLNKDVEHFAKEFGLILFVYTIGLQVGPGFFSSLKKQGLALNMLALIIVLTGALVTIALIFLTNTPVHVMAGIMSGAVTNTPGLGAAQQALFDVNTVNAERLSQLNLGYAVAYPFGVIGIILVMILLQKIFRVNIQKENERYQQTLLKSINRPERVNLVVQNAQLFGRPLGSLSNIINASFVVSRIQHAGIVQAPTDTILLQSNDVLLIVTQKEDLEKLKLFIGNESETDLAAGGSNLISRRVVVTKTAATRKPLKNLLVPAGFNVTRISRAGIEFVATQSTQLQIGDEVTVVGEEAAVMNCAKILGNSLKRLDHPQLAPVFTGVVLGVILGSIPLMIPGVPAPVKIGLAGGPLIIALVVSRFGSKFWLGTYMTQSANLMLREIGIVLFLASVGLSSGHHFIEILSNGDGLKWMLYGIIITLVPLLLTGLVATAVLKKSYFEVCGLLSGASTDPPALAFATQTTGSDAPAVTYATVYPITMIARILVAQLLVLILAG